MDPQNIARIAHEADRAFCALHGDLKKVWASQEAHERECAVRGVKIATATPRATAADLHTSWLRDKREAGWRFGPQLDLHDRLDPMMIPWEQLSDYAQARERLFLAVVRSLAPQS